MIDSLEERPSVSLFVVDRKHLRIDLDANGLRFSRSQLHPFPPNQTMKGFARRIRQCDVYLRDLSPRPLARVPDREAHDTFTALVLDFQAGVLIGCVGESKAERE